MPAVVLDDAPTCGDFEQGTRALCMDDDVVLAENVQCWCSERWREEVGPACVAGLEARCSDAEFTIKKLRMW